MCLRHSTLSLLQAVASKVTDEELARAKKATISSVLMNLESRAVVAEDIGRQVLTYGHRCTHQTARLCTKKSSCTCIGLQMFAAG